jgi:hypothetical protein
VVLQKPELTAHQPTRDFAFFLKVLKSRDFSGCRNISDSILRTYCEALSRNDERVCEKCEGVSRFREAYLAKQKK